MTALALLAVLAAPSADPHQAFAEANAAAARGELEAAVAGYEALLAAGVVDGHLSYNLGNAHLRRGAVGRAIASYLEALRQLPRDEDVRANLTLARSRIQDAVPPPEPSPLVSTLAFWHYALAPRELWGLLVFVNLLLWSSLGARVLWARDPVARARAGVAAVVLGLMTVALFGSALARWLSPAPIAVVSAAEASVLAAQDPGASVRFVLHDGAEARVLEEDRDWVRVALVDGKQGWVARGQVTLVER